MKSKNRSVVVIWHKEPCVLQNENKQNLGFNFDTFLVDFLRIHELGSSILQM